jgi:dTDP-4-amino-4,6-dideoxygalactose transaminase
MADAAQSFGATLDGRPVGSVGRIATTSFFPAKPLGCYGDGGAVFTDDDELADVVRSLRVHGKGTDKYDNVRVGMNGRLDTIQAAILLEKLSIFDEELAARSAVAERYGQALADVVQIPVVLEGATSAWAQYTLVVAERRDEVARVLRQAGVPTAVYYPSPLHCQSAYERYPRVSSDLPVSIRLSRQVLSLPMHPYLDDATQTRVVGSLASALRS